MNYRAVVGVYRLLAERGGWVKGKELWESFKKRVGGASKRTFYYYLERLEEEGLIESRQEGREKLYRLKEAFSCAYAPEELGFLVYHLLSTAQELKLRNAPLLKALVNKLCEANAPPEELLERAAVNRELYSLFSREDFELLGRFTAALFKRKRLYLNLSDGRVLSGVPVKLFYRNGEVYALLKDGEREELVNLLHVRNFTEGKEEPVGPPSTALTERFDGEAFVFGVEFHEKYMFYDPPPKLFFPTQYFFRHEKGYYSYFFVGYTSDNFAQAFLPILYDRILAPSKEMLERAKALKLNERYPSLDLKSLETNLNRFMLFLEQLEKHLDLRNAIVKGLKAGLRALE
ncbi:MAG: hypothetical protein GXO03_03020 [Aquificae bacterium]|nr:hypothetical protein [Aquificota bacterium]